MCVVEEICAADGKANDEHTAHGTERHQDTHYCYWQPTSRVAPSGQHGWNGPDGWQQLFLLPSVLGVPEATCYRLDVAPVPSSVRFKAFCHGRPSSRRGPPLV